MIGADARLALERQIRELQADGNSSAAVTAALRGFGPEIYEFLVACDAGGSHADDAFSDYCEALWRMLPTFRWESTMRTWSYAVARRSLLRQRRDASRRSRRQAAIPSDSELDALATKVRTETASFLRSHVRTRIQELRKTLPEEDQTVLLLRVDRGLGWDEIAEVMRADDADPTREAARLRKRFQLAKEKLYRLAQREGLVGS